jgi:hypothetical protein
MHIKCDELFIFGSFTVPLPLIAYDTVHDLLQKSAGIQPAGL